MHQPRSASLSLGGRLLLGALVVAGLVGGALVIRQTIFPPKPAAPAPGDRPEGRAALLARGKQVFDNSCAPCHGEKGTGDGPAARFLYPRPRDFTEAKFRFITTVNRVPSDADLLHIINRGMPGSAMFPFAHLPEEDRLALVAHVRELTRQGLEARLRAEATRNGEEADPDELAEAVTRLTVPGADLAMPAQWPAAEAASVERGKEQYRVLCIGCHGPTGKGDGGQEQKDDNGMPTRPRDFTRGIFKGGREPRQIYSRLLLGLPGTPMPAASQGIGPEQASDLTNFILTLSDPAVQTKVEHHRTLLTARRAPAPLGEDIAEGAWSAVPPTFLVVSPLWWRDDAEPDLNVQALHDGQTLAIRLTWVDATRNAQAVKPQEFEDMAAVQLFQGSPEPFLGMGAAGQVVDLWLWRAGANGGRFADVATTYPHMAVDPYPLDQPGKGPPPEFLTARSVGNLRSDPETAAAAGSLQAKGFGSATMRPRPSQLVASRGEWKDGRWAVVLRRPLQVPADAGLPLAAGAKLSVAFALWDGAARDRNGQKLVSIWHDLQLE
jgi:mono/diheme cytochrome c family protein